MGNDTVGQEFNEISNKPAGMIGMNQAMMGSGSHKETKIPSKSKGKGSSGNT